MRIHWISKELCGSHYKYCAFLKSNLHVRGQVVFNQKLIVEHVVWECIGLDTILSFRASNQTKLPSQMPHSSRSKISLPEQHGRKHKFGWWKWGRDLKKGSSKIWSQEVVVGVLGGDTNRELLLSRLGKWPIGSQRKFVCCATSEGQWFFWSKLIAVKRII